MVIAWMLILIVVIMFIIGGVTAVVLIAARRKKSNNQYTQDAYTQNQYTHNTYYVPRLIVETKVVHKRTGMNLNRMNARFLNYYVSFQFEGGDQKEFQVDELTYKMYDVGAIGKVEFQGNRYLGFRHGQGK